MTEKYVRYRKWRSFGDYTVIVLLKFEDTECTKMSGKTQY